MEVELENLEDVEIVLFIPESKVSIIREVQLDGGRLEFKFGIFNFVNSLKSEVVRELYSSSISTTSASWKINGALCLSL